MSTETKLDVAALRALLAKATPGKWEATGRAIDRADAPFTEIAVDRCDADWCGNSSGIERSDDAALIAAAVNALPALLDAVEGAGGLVFVPVGGSLSDERAALSVDGHYYTVAPWAHGKWVWAFHGHGTFADTESAAIEAARAHDRARRGSR